MLALLTSLWIPTAAAQDLGFGFTPAPAPGENPALFVTPARTVADLHAECDVGGKKIEFDRKNVPAGQKQRFEWKDRTPHVECFIRASFADGDVSEQTVPIDFQFQGKLSVDLSHASADLKARTVSVNVTSPVNEAEIVAYGEHKSELDRRTVPLSGGPGKVDIPFVGEPSDVVLLDVTVKSGNAWAGFTYSPWFLDIPHDDVLFPSDGDQIPPSEVWKLQATLERLNDVIEKYGSVVPVKLYIAGCTDTVGDASHNLDLSQRRAQAIARWLRANGYNLPIYYHGFGEGLLAVPTGDNEDNALNRRALYMVGANPPPAGSGIPSVGWKAL
jgi:outer membrane protein OmpA-like peptidoglycan-associated protein